MRTETDKRRQPIVEWWRIGAVVLIVAVAMLFVHAIEPADAEASRLGAPRQSWLP